MFNPKFIIIALVCLFTSFISKAQSDTLIYYLDDHNQFLNSKEGAETMRFVIRANKKERYHVVKDYYMSGNIKALSESSKDDGSDFHGIIIGYFENGKRAIYRTYHDDRTLNSYINYYRNGQIAVSGTYNQYDGMLIDEFRDSLGTILATGGNGTGVEYDDPPIKNGPIEKGPVKNGKIEGEWVRTRDRDTLARLYYKGGVLKSGIGYDSLQNAYLFTSTIEVQKCKTYGFGITNFLESKIKLTKEAKKNNIKGLIMLQFIIENDGSLSNISVVHGLGYGLDEQAVAALKLTDHQWIPQKIYGIPQRQFYRYRISVGMY